MFVHPGLQSDQLTGPTLMVFSFFSLVVFTFHGDSRSYIFWSCTRRAWKVEEDGASPKLSRRYAQTGSVPMDQHQTQPNMSRLRSQRRLFYCSCDALLGTPGFDLQTDIMYRKTTTVQENWSDLDRGSEHKENIHRGSGSLNLFLEPRNHKPRGRAVHFWTSLHELKQKTWLGGLIGLSCLVWKDCCGLASRGVIPQALEHCIALPR